LMILATDVRAARARGDGGRGEGGNGRRDGKWGKFVVINVVLNVSAPQARKILGGRGGGRGGASVARAQIGRKNHQYLPG